MRAKKAAMAEAPALEAPPVRDVAAEVYQAFLRTKTMAALNATVPGNHDLTDCLFPFQRDIVAWALRKGRAAIWADCGLGKGWMALEWARIVAKNAGPVLLLAPLAVAQQFIREADKMGVRGVAYRREQPADLGPITITNYEMLDRFDISKFAGGVLDESSRLKAYDGKQRTQIIEAFKHTPHRLACTATPAPNDHMELGNHAEFLGVSTRAEMLATYFIHDGGDTSKWRLKGHAETAFWRWVGSWGCMIRKPSDLGYDDGGFVLPPLVMSEHVVKTPSANAAGMLFAMDARTLEEQRAARRASLPARVAKAAALANDSREQWIVWGELNDECDALEELIPDAVQVSGSDSIDEKERKLLDFTEGRARVLVSKASVAGFGMNWQHCSNVVYVGLSHSFEQFYQSVRRCWRFGQSRPVNVHVVVGDLEGRVVANIKRKEADAETMAIAMVANMAEIRDAEIRGSSRNSIGYSAGVDMKIPGWLTSGPA